MSSVIERQANRLPTAAEIIMADEWMCRCARIQEIMERAGLRNAQADPRFDENGRFGILVTWDWNRGPKKTRKDKS